MLDARGISVAFGGVSAVSDVDLHVEAGELLGVIGPNGAGKTTLIDAILGFVDARGEIVLDGAARIDRLSPHRRARAGVVRTWQSVELFTDLTVADNVRVGVERVTALSFLRDLFSPRRRPPPDEVTSVMAFLGISDWALRSAADLSAGQAQLVGLARAIASRPKVVFMDEPAAGLDTRETQSLATQIRRLVDDGVAVVLVDHDMDLVFSICDRIQVMQAGRTLAIGTVAEIRENDQVRAAYLGGRGEETSAAGHAGTQEVAGRQ